MQDVDANVLVLDVSAWTSLLVLLRYGKWINY